MMGLFCLFNIISLLGYISVLLLNQYHSNVFFLDCRVAMSCDYVVLFSRVAMSCDYVVWLCDHVVLFCRVVMPCGYVMWICRVEMSG